MYDDMLELSDISYKPDISPQDIFLKTFTPVQNQIQL